MALGLAVIAKAMNVERNLALAGQPLCGLKRSAGDWL
jgi:hypothetical protein